VIKAQKKAIILAMKKYKAEETKKEDFFS